MIGVNPTKQALEFYDKNKDLKWRMPAIPSGLTTDFQIAQWVMNNNLIGWLELDLTIDLPQWKQESLKVDDYFVDHRGIDHPGWNSCCIHGISTDKSGSWNTYGYQDESEVPYDWTELSTATPIIKKFWNEFPFEKYRRIRFMQLAPNGCISPHSDAPGRLHGETVGVNMLEHGAPVNIAIVHPVDCHMTVEGFGVVPWEEGKVFIINIRHYHSVINFSNNPRVHMIGHGWYGADLPNFCELVTRSYRKQYELHRKL